MGRERLPGGCRVCRLLGRWISASLVLLQLSQRPSRYRSAAPALHLDSREGGWVLRAVLRLCLEIPWDLHYPSSVTPCARAPATNTACHRIGCLRQTSKLITHARFPRSFLQLPRATELSVRRNGRRAHVQHAAPGHACDALRDARSKASHRGRGNHPVEQPPIHYIEDTYVAIAHEPMVGVLRSAPTGV